MAQDIKLIVQAILDDKDFKKGVKGIKTGFDGASKKAKTHGSAISKLKGAYLAIAAVMTGAVVAGLSRIVKAGIDAQETFSKFATVFRSVRDQAESTAKDFAASFGLSGVAAKKLLGDTGDLLSGFGFTGQAALDMSNEVNRLAVDLASFTNFAGGAEGASAALTRGLLGEREAMKSLGIAIGEADIKQRALVEGMDPKSLTRQEKAMLTLKIAMEQSKNAIGDFARTNTQAANLIRIFRARFEDIIVTIGSKFIPIIEKALPVLNDWLTSIDKALTDVPKTIQEFRDNTDKALKEFMDAPLRSIRDFVEENEDIIKRFGISAAREVGIFLLKVLNVALKFTGKFASLFSLAFDGIVKGINKIAGTDIPTLGEAFNKITESLDFTILEMEASLGKFADAAEKTDEEILESSKKKNEGLVADAALTNEEIAEINKELQEVNKSIREDDINEEIAHLNSLLDVLRQHGALVIKEEKKLQLQINMLEVALQAKRIERFQMRAKLLQDFAKSFESIGESMLTFEKRRLKNMQLDREHYDEQDIAKQKTKMRTIAKFNRNVASFQAAVDAAAAVVKTMASIPYPLNIPLAIAQGAAGAMQVQRIRSEPLPEFQRGIESMGSDTFAKLHKGERVIPERLNVEGLSNEALMASAMRGMIPSPGASGAVDNSRTNTVTENIQNTFNVPEGTLGIEEVMEFARQTNSDILRR